jgi:Reverse transcriptase (RNA-dependent DNA polymerase)
VSFGDAKVWVLIVDDYTDYCWSLFLKEKRELKEKMIELLTDLKIAGINIKFICCDDSGENKAFQKECKSKALNIISEFLGPKTPPHNSKVERKFQTFYGRITATLKCTGLKDRLRNCALAEYARTVTFLSNSANVSGFLKLKGTVFLEHDWLLVDTAKSQMLISMKGLHRLEWCKFFCYVTAFLHGNLQEEIYMSIPDGLVSHSNECLRLKKTIYGLIQSAKEFYKKLIEVLKSVGFVENKVDPRVNIAIFLLLR